MTLGFDKVCKEIDYFVTRLTGLKFKALNEVSPLLLIQLKIEGFEVFTNDWQTPFDNFLSTY